VRHPSYQVAVDATYHRPHQVFILGAARQMHEPPHRACGPAEVTTPLESLDFMAKTFQGAKHHLFMQL